MVLGEKYKIATVGCGVQGEAHLRTLKKINSLKVVAVCDKDEKKAIRASTKWDIDRYYSDFFKMLDNEDLSIVSIITPPDSHALLAVEAIKHGINVLVEKPLTMTTRDADSIMNALKQSDVKMTVAYHLLFSKAMLESLSLIRKQVIGDVLGAEFKFLHTREDPMTSNPNHWCHELPGGRFGEMLPHPVYILQSILGDNLRVKKIFTSKRGSYPWMPHDELKVILQSARGLGSIYVSFNAPRPAILIDVYGTEKILKIDLLGHTVIELGRIHGDSKFDLGKDCLWRAYKMSFLTIKNAVDFFLIKRQQSALRNIYTMFKDSIKKNVEPLVTPKMAYNTVRIVGEICQGI